MEITEIAVEVSEVRDHPFEHANYRASVGLTAHLTDGDDPERVTAVLRKECRTHALDECDGWERMIRREHQIDEATEALKAKRALIYQYGSSKEEAEYYYDEACAVLEEADLPPVTKDEWRERLRQARDERIEFLEAKKADEEGCYDQLPY
jgi:hypothetical protein